MTISCRQCYWSQDDFWDEGYNPFTCLEFDRDRFLAAMAKPATGRTENLDIGFIRDRQIPGTLTPAGWYAVNVAELIARRFEEMAKQVRNMKWWTADDFNRDPDPTCPLCGGRQLSGD